MSTSQFGGQTGRDLELAALDETGVLAQWGPEPGVPATRTPTAGVARPSAGTVRLSGADVRLLPTHNGRIIELAHTADMVLRLDATLAPGFCCTIVLLADIVATFDGGERAVRNAEGYAGMSRQYGFIGLYLSADPEEFLFSGNAA